MSEQTSGRVNPLGISFLVLGASLCVVFALTLGPAFIGLGVPFIALGAIFSSKSGDAQKGEQEGTQDK